MPGMRHGSYRRVAVRLVECVPRAKHVVAVRAWWRARIERVNCEVGDVTVRRISYCLPTLRSHSQGVRWSAEGTCTKSYRRQAQTSDKEIGV
ncbi:hypothetical protein HBI56_044800 [Parastagonospora nodorum]|uniref:Uncharacterized protein n=1 Tax=Phaeosphaeria nodorum (strain SN15 / ATCC MYA-4574 / FGSC 10173) TaxID=321614 RepID=A0A7U2ETE7_PHANO|nr:hypothetical protein HBH56_057920 [Parastagonospora nodorum]QRC91683.1 hypothetical protein JI435_301190 [Parastagonospora nodorum SN15]KAH3930857.1 hypothetical protein HBH54_101850 [Parastagonospora nodorum]KAH3943781.1 hypothetical protein HBH53_167980 [Parastagonospora nodorum]KAH3977553.1 hypothetical protein HBH52_110950 [Parastagonospora nodorum]